MVVLKGTQLIGARFTIYNRTDTHHYYLIVDDMDTMLLWAQSTPTIPRSTNTYHLVWMYRDLQMHAIERVRREPRYHRQHQ